MADAIFISYRRDDSEGEAGRLFDDLVRAFGNDAVFMDVTGIKPGIDFRKAIEDNVASCGVLLAMIGPSWASITGADGKRRLEDPNDFVALEIASALRRGVPVIPVLVHDAKMPAPGLLPESLKDFSYRNSVEISHARWNSDVQLLEEALKSYVKPSASTPSEPVHATVPVQLPAPHHPSESPAVSQKKPNLPLMIGLGVIAAALIIAVVVYALRSSPSPDQQNPVIQASPAASPAAAAASPAAAAPSASSVPGAAAEFIGTWKRSGGQGDSDALGMLVISSSGGGLTVHAYGRCQAPVCDWGQQPGVIQGQKLVATFSPTPNGSDTSRTAEVTAQTAPGGLNVLIQNTFQNPAGSRKSFSHPLFVSAQ